MASNAVPLNVASSGASALSAPTSGRETWIATAALIRDTFREALARKIFWGFFGCSTALILFFLLIMRIDVVQGSIATISIFNQTHAQDVNQIVLGAHAGVAVFLYTAGMFLAVFASAGLIAAVFEPGRIELLLSKPVRRHHILLGRYAGNLLVVASNLAYLVLSIWIIFGLKTGVWTNGFLISSALTLFIFASLLTVITLVGVLWESAAVSMMATFGIMLLSPILAQTKLIAKLLSSEWSRNIVRGLYYILPKVFDIGHMIPNLVKGEPIESWMPIWSTALFSAVVLSAAVYMFSRKDF